jgi:hypothetical protein
MKKIIFTLITFCILFTNWTVYAELDYEVKSIPPIYNDGDKIDCDLYQYETFGIIVPKNLDTEKQLLKQDILAENFLHIDEKFREGIKYLYLLDFEESREKYYSERNIHFNIIATYDDNRIYFYENDDLDDHNSRWEITILPRVLMHEVAHNYNAINKISCTEEWKSMVDNDKKILYSFKIFSNYSEEFAESMALYYTDENRLKKRCPERYKFISKLFE